MNPKEHLEISKLISKLLDKGAIKPCNDSRDQFISSIFLVPKPDGTNRFILNLKELNELISAEHFKLEDRKAVINLMSEDCFMATVDLKDAYYVVPVAESDRKFLRFRHNNQLFEFTCLPFGLTTAPYVFTKILKPVMANLRRRDFLSVIYLDDILLFGRSYEECQSNTLSTRLLLGQLGFVINEKKCQLIPSRKCKFLGFLFDSERMIIELTQDKRDRVKREVEKYRAIKVCKIRRFAEFVGLVGSCCPAVMYGLGHTKLFEKARYLALESSKGSYDSCMTLDKDLQTDFKWWGKNIRHAHRSTRPPEFCREIFTDASLSGWGVACGQARSHGFWNEEERKSHINILELTTAFFGLKCFANDLRYCDILLRLDNTTAISYINRMGGVRFARLSNLARKIWDWCEERDIWIFASFISSKDNFEADFESRRLEPETELELSQTAFKRIVRTFGEPEVDLFATRVNKKCRKYISWLQDPNSIAVDAFTVPWKNYFFYAFPPFVIILRRTTSSLEKNYPGCRTVIRRSFAMRGIPAESMEIMIASLRDSSLKQYNSALKKWWNFCVERDTNPFRTSVVDVLVLLTKEYNNGASRGSLNCLRSAIALITGPEIGQDSRIRRLFKGVSELRPSKPKYEQTWDPRIVL
ncbi:uncharacterized protein LOC124411363 [Diprion similis]|uniref:uncharacterized protein LOC124411363 n=1 Tax=Diprion similis TaxID=362088 RepID=UPI001EF7D6A1|nr:uncharacterized protein LOC124411363 [Diprion similis]